MIAYSLGSYDILRETDLQEIDKQIQLSKENGINIFAIGVYEDDLCQVLGLNRPLKSVADRLKIMSYIRGIDFVFSVPSLDENIIKARLTAAFEQFENSKKDSKNPKSKKFELGYAPGTYDLFHAGHLENLLIADSNCEKLIVGVKGNELVQKHKNKLPIISDNERVAILRHFKFVYDSYIYYTRDLHIANDYIKSKYNKSIDAVFLGSDLKNDFKDTTDINIIYTERKEELMKERSTTAYAKRYSALSLGKHKPQKFSGKISERLLNKDLDNEVEK